MEGEWKENERRTNERSHEACSENEWKIANDSSIASTLEICWWTLSIRFPFDFYILGISGSECLESSISL